MRGRVASQGKTTTTHGTTWWRGSCAKVRLAVPTVRKRETCCALWATLKEYTDTSRAHKFIFLFNLYTNYIASEAVLHVALLIEKWQPGAGLEVGSSFLVLCPTVEVLHNYFHFLLQRLLSQGLPSI